MLRDDLDLDHEYSVSANHDEAHGVEIRKKIWKVTAILTIITIVEVITGGQIKQFVGGEPNSIWPFIKWAFIIMTVVKAGYIVMIFMHLGDERKNFSKLILIPYAVFIAYLIFICLMEATYWNGNLY